MFTNLEDIFNYSIENKTVKELREARKEIIIYFFKNRRHMDIDEIEKINFKKKEISKEILNLNNQL